VAIYSAQAILISNIVVVFTYPEPQLTNRGNFFSAMFVVLAAACFLFYFSLGYSTNNIAQQMNYKYREQVFQDMIRQDLQFFDRPENSTGSLAARAEASSQSISYWS
jgi:ATP-binding cassette subfamily B (MDR/TAP) protein 1